MTHGCRRWGALIVVMLAANATATAQQGSLTPQAASQIDPGDASSLVGRWQLERIEYAKDKIVTPASPEKYRVEFTAGGNLVAQLDCNRGRGSYTVAGSTITIEPILATLMACGQGSIATEFTKALQLSTSFRRANDTLILSMRNDAGTVHMKLIP